MGDTKSCCFNPRSPCGERLYDGLARCINEVFQPTLPLRGATIAGLVAAFVLLWFQPTLPLRGATRRSVAA